MDARHSVFVRLVWWLTPLGRVRLALLAAAKPRDPDRACARMKSALSVLHRPSYADRPETRELTIRVLAQLGLLCVNLGSHDAVADCLAQLEDITAPIETRLDLRWTLVSDLIKRGATEKAIEQACLFIAEPLAPADRVAELLDWALTSLDRTSAITVAGSASESVPADPLLRTLRALCEAPERFVDRAEAESVSRNIDPDLITDQPAIQGRAYLVKAQCAEAMEDHEAMLTAAEAARGTGSYDDLSRYWRARALLHLRKPDEAASVMREAPRDTWPEWERLEKIAELSARRTLDLADPCVRLLEDDMLLLPLPLPRELFRLMETQSRPLSRAT